MNGAQIFNGLFDKKEELHEDLQPYVIAEERLNGVKCLKHPLVYSLFYTDAENALLNEQYRVRLAHITKCLENGNIGGYIFMHEKPFRLVAFKQYIKQKQITDKVYWETLRSIWMGSENIWQEMKDWRFLLSSKRKERGCFMDLSDRIVLADLPQTVTVYRGHHGVNENGYSYTLDKEKAQWFADRFGSHKGVRAVKTITVSKSDIFAYLNSRGEKEVILMDSGKSWRATTKKELFKKTVL